MVSAYSAIVFYMIISHFYFTAFQKNGYIAKGSNYVVLISCLHFQFGSTLKEKNLLLEEQILSFSSISSPELFHWPGK